MGLPQIGRPGQRTALVDNKHAHYMRIMQTLGFDLAETSRLMRRDFDRRAAALGATRAQWRVLARLWRQDGLRQVDLADALDVEPITLCRMVDRLEEAGLVERRKDEGDRRAWRIHLTGRAEPVLQELQAIGTAFHADALEGISPAEQEAVAGVLERIKANLNRRRQL